MTDFGTILDHAIARVIIDEYAWGLTSPSEIAHRFNVQKEKVEEIILTLKRMQKGVQP